MNAQGKSRLWWTLGLLFVCTLGVLALRPRPIPVDIALVKRGSFEQTVDEDGKTRVRERYVVSAPLDGTLERIFLKAGDPVEQDMVLAVLQPKIPALLDVRTEKELTARLHAAEAAQRRARAEIERAQAALAQAQADDARAQALANEGLLAPARREQAETAVIVATKDVATAQFAAQVATHQVATARAALLRAQNSGSPREPNERWEIRSPVMGRVLRVMHEDEGAVSAGTPLLELADPSQLEIVVDVLSSDAVQIPPQAPVLLEHWGGRPIHGRVRLVEPAAFTKVSALGVEEQRVNVIIDIVTPHEQWENLGDGYRVDASIVVFHQDNGVIVPTGALFRDGEEWAVFVVRDGYAHLRTIGVQRRNSREATVADGLTPGEVVVVYPSDNIHHGTRVVAK
ncbi:MAG: efflux RND transporter periplasmic adaptor subunit [Candidatus Binatia bacterium]